MLDSSSSSVKTTTLLSSDQIRKLIWFDLSKLCWCIRMHHCSTMNFFSDLSQFSWWEFMRWNSGIQVFRVNESGCYCIILFTSIYSLIWDGVGKGDSLTHFCDLQMKVWAIHHCSDWEVCGNLAKTVKAPPMLSASFWILVIRDIVVFRI